MLRLRGLSVAYGERPVLRRLDLEVAAGEFVGLVGPNGCGKTTLLRAVTRVVPWSEGEVLLGGRPVSAISTRDLARMVAVVPQNPVLPLGYSAREVVLMGRTPHLGFLDQEGPEDYRRADAALERVGAGQLGGRRVDELSGGERQSVLLARAMAQEAGLLLLDEPTANLDLGHQIAFAGLVRDLAASGLAVLAAIHDLTLASLYCDRIALMAEGRIVADGPPDGVLTPDNLANAYGVEALILRPPELARPIIVPYSA